MSTGGSKSVWLDFPIYSRAGAAGRIALIEAGAKLLGVSPSQCVARQGAVFAANQSISYGEIVRRGEPTRKFTPDELAQLPIKPASERRLIGKKTDALDIPAKINGTARYGIDAVGRRHGLCPAEDSPDALRFGGPRGRRFRGEAGQGLSHEPRARGPLQYGARLGRRVRDVLSGGDPCRRPRQGRLGRGRCCEGVRAGHPRLRRQADRRTAGRCAFG